MIICEMRTQHEAMVKYKRTGKKPKKIIRFSHLFTSRRRVVGQEWEPYHCSWCGVKQKV